MASRGGSVFLFRRNGTQLWKVSQPSLYLPYGMSFPRHNRFLLIYYSASAVLRTNGSVRWAASGDAMNAGRNLGTFVT